MNVERITLPKAFKNEIIFYNNENHTIIIESNAVNPDECRLWIEHFSRETCSSWFHKDLGEVNSRNTKHRKVFLCHFYSSKKCPATITFSARKFKRETITKSTHNDTRLQSTIYLNLNHNHAISDATRPPAPKYSLQTLQEFRKYYSDGFDARSAHKFHEKRCLFQLSNLSEYEIPDFKTVCYWFRSWKHAKIDREMHSKALKKLKSKLPSYAAAGHLVFVSIKPFAIALITPKMSEVYRLVFNNKAIFVESRSSRDKHYFLSFLMVHCAAGVVPVGVIITKKPSFKSYLAAFELLQTAFSHLGTGHIDCTFFIGDNEKQKRAIEHVWPSSVIIINRRSIVQIFWNWLFKASCKIEKEHRPLVFDAFTQMLFSANVTDAERYYALFSNENEDCVGKYLKPYVVWKERVDSYWQRKQLWCSAFQETSAHLQNCDYISISTRLFMTNYVIHYTELDFVGMLDYICFSLDNKLHEQLKSFLDNYRDTPRTYLLKEMKRHVYSKESPVEEFKNFTFLIPPRIKKGLPYHIHALYKLCSCFLGKLGIFCKHLCTFFYFRQEFLPPMPSSSAKDWHNLATIVYTNNAPSLSFYQYFIKSEDSVATTLKNNVSEVHNEGSQNDVFEVDYIVELNGYKYYVQK